MFHPVNWPFLPLHRVVSDMILFWDFGQAFLYWQWTPDREYNFQSTVSLDVLTRHGLFVPVSSLMILGTEKKEPTSYKQTTPTCTCS